MPLPQPHPPSPLRTTSHHQPHPPHYSPLTSYPVSALSRLTCRPRHTVVSLALIPHYPRRLLARIFAVVLSCRVVHVVPPAPPRPRYCIPLLPLMVWPPHLPYPRSAAYAAHRRNGPLVRPDVRGCGANVYVSYVVESRLSRFSLASSSLDYMASFCYMAVCRSLAYITIWFLSLPPRPVCVFVVVFALHLLPQLRTFARLHRSRLTACRRGREATRTG